MVDTQPVQLSADQFAQLLGRLAGGTGNAGENGPKSVKPTRPSIDVETTEGEWAIFDDQWSRFKRMAKLTAIVDIRDNQPTPMLYGPAEQSMVRTEDNGN